MNATMHQSTEAITLPADPHRTPALRFSVLGRPGWDNALSVEASGGDSITRFLFDCGDQCLRAMTLAQLQKIDFILFSHLHFDHIAGFDSFLRCNFDRPGGAISIFGPPGTAAIIQHRLQGVLWDRTDGTNGRFIIGDIHPTRIERFEARSNEGFRTLHSLESTPFSGTVLETSALRLEALHLDHGSPCMGYLLTKRGTSGVNVGRLKELGLPSGPWLKSVKDLGVADDAEVLVAGSTRLVGELRGLLLESRPDEKIGYLTDFRATAAEWAPIVRLFKGCDVLVCENNFGDAESEQATRSFHMTSSEVAELAHEIDPRSLIVFHISDRYDTAQKRDLLATVRRRFARAYFPSEWAGELA